MNKTISFISVLGMFTLITIGCEDITQKTIEENSSSSLSTSSAFSSSLLSVSSSSTLSSFASSSSQESGINSTQSKNTLGYYGEETLFANRSIIGWWTEIESESSDEGIKYSFGDGYGFNSDGTGSIFKGSSQVDFTYGVDAQGEKIVIDTVAENGDTLRSYLDYIESNSSCAFINKIDENQSVQGRLCKTYPAYGAIISPDFTPKNHNIDNSAFLENDLGYYGKGVKFGGYDIINTFLSDDYNFEFKENGRLGDNYDNNYYNGRYYGVDRNGTTLTIVRNLDDEPKEGEVWRYLGDREDCMWIETESQGLTAPGQLEKRTIQVCLASEELK